LLGGQWKEKEKVPLLGGQWKEKEKVLLLGGQWKEKEKEKVPLLGGQWKEKEKVPLHLLPLPPKQTYFYLRPFFTHSLPFLAYKLRSHNLMSQIPSTFIAI
jgi:hypothetical protein